MKNNVRFLLLFVITLGLGICSNAQTIPQFFNSNNTTSNNAFPLNSTTNKVQWINAPNAFSSLGGGLGVPAYAGNITRVYFRIQTGFSTNPTSTYNIQLSLGQSVGTQLAFTSTTYITGITQVYTNSSFNFTGIVAGQWYGITLQTPFTYNPSLSLIYEMKQLGGTGNTLAQGNFTSGDRIWGTYAATAGTGFGGGRVDFGFDLTPNTPCIGTPTAGTPTGPINPCPGVNATYYLTGATLAGGLKYQWINSSVGCNGPWNIMLNDTNSSFSTQPPLGVTTYYRCVVTCSNTTLFDTSSCLAVTPQTWTPYSPCYCTSGATLTNLEDIGQFSIGSLSNPANPPTPQNANVTSVNLYSNFDTLLPVPIFIQGQTYPISAFQISTGTNFDSWFKTWIDYNHNTSWLDVGEEVFSSASNAGNGYAPSGFVTIPTTALPGVTRLRAVLNRVSVAGSVTPCGTYNYGETEDYVVNILAAGPHDPAVTNIQVTPNGGCMDSCETVTLTVSNFGSTILDLSTNPLTINLNVNGPNGLTVYTQVANSAFLSPFNTNSTFVTFPCVNFHEGGCYTINTDTLSLLGSFNTNKVNDSLFTAITVCNSRPNALDYTLCLNDTIPTGLGLNIANCPTGFVQDSVFIPFTLSFAGNTVPNPTASAPTGASLFASGTLPTLPPSANMLSGQLSVSNLQLAGLTFTTGPNLTRFSLFTGPTPAPNANIYHGGLQGNALTSLPFGCFNYLSTPSAADLNSMYTSGVPTLSPTLNLGHWSTNRPIAPNVAANCGGSTVAVLKIIYEYIPIGIKWYEQKTGGISISNASPFDPLSVTNNIVNSNSGVGSYTFFGACAADTNCRVEVDLNITGLTYATILDTATSCFGDSTGSIAATINGGVAPFVFNLTGPVTPASNSSGYFPNLPAGNYILNVSDATGCGSGDSTIIIGQPAAVVLDSIISTSPSCTPGGDAVLTVYASGGTPPLATYNIGSGPQASNVFPNLGANVYTVTAADARGCTAQSTHTIVVSTPPTWASLSSTNLQCFGDSTGTITVSAIPGSNATIGYAKVPALPALTQLTSGNFSVVKAGTYTIRATDGNNCFIDTTVTITQPARIQYASITKTQPTCNGAANGGLTILASSGTPGYNYRITAPTAIGPNTTGVFTGLPSGNHTVRITDTFGCTRDSVINLAQPAILTLNITSITNVLCRGASTGVIVATGVGGTAPMNTTAWTISPSSGTQSGNRTFSNLPAGTYTITGTDANGCTATTSVTITQPATNVQITNVTSTTPSCNPGCDANMTITATGGTVPSYSYSNGTPLAQPNPLFTNQCAGTYTVSVTDGNGCTATSTHTISTPGSPTWGVNSVTKTDVNCNGGTNGSINFVATPGTNPTITYNRILPLPVQNNITSPLTNLPAGSYTIQAVDGNGCSIQTVVTINQPAVLTIDTASVADVLCNGNSTGTIVMTSAGGTGTPNYVMTSPPTGVLQSPPGTFINVPAGTYTITGTDQNLCVATTTVTVTQPTALVYTSIVTTNVICNGANNGSIVAQSSGGAGAITTVLLPSTAPSPATPPTFSGLNGGQKTIRISNGSGCIRDTVVTILEPALLVVDTLSVSNVLCKDDSTGTIIMTRTGGVGAINYGISPTNPTITIVDSTISNLPAGIYTITGTDGNGCIATRTVTITEPATQVDITAIIGTTPTCVPGNDGTITPTATGGTGTLIATLPPSIIPYPLPGTITGLGSANYLVRVTDVNGCFADTNFTISNSSAPTVDSTKNTTTLCFGDSTGTLQVFATGTPQASVTYAIVAPAPFVTPPQASGLFTGLPAGSYSIQVNDANNCPVSATVTINQPTRVRFISVVTDSVNCNGGNDGSIIVIGTGGTGPLSSTRSPFPTVPTTSATPTFTYNNLAATTYVVRLQDGNGCRRDSSIIIRQPSAVSMALVSQTAVLCNGGSTGSVTVSSAGGTGTKNYILNPGAIASTTGFYTNLAAGNYTITATDFYSCSTSLTVTVTQPTAVTQTFVTRNVTCFGGNDGLIRLTANGGVGNYTYGLIPSSPALTGVDSFTNLLAGSIYQGIVSDSNGCRDSSANIIITEPTQMVFTSVSKIDIDCFGGRTGSINVASNMGTGTHSYIISPDPNSVGTLIGSPKTISNLPAGTYVITATDGNNCSIITSVTLTQNPQIFFSSITNTEERCFGDGQASITFQAGGGLNPFTYIFDVNGNPQGPSTINTYDSLGTGIYTIRAIDALGCSADSSYTLTGPDPITFTEFDIVSATCLDTKDGKLTVQATGGRGTEYTYDLGGGFIVNTTGIFRDLEPNEYRLVVTDSAGCTLVTDVIIPLPSTPLTVVVEKQDLGCHGRGNEGRAEAFATGGTQPYTYFWSSTPVQTTAKATGLYKGIHTVDVVDASGCLERDTIIIEPGPCCQDLFLPNAFSPNGDGRNDEFRILSTADMVIQQFEVRNRWGVKVWETTNTRSSWDGNYGTEPVGVGTYYYILRYKCLTDNETYTVKGDVTIVR